jgi:hypothetical protein
MSDVTAYNREYYRAHHHGNNTRGYHARGEDEPPAPIFKPSVPECGYRCKAFYFCRLALAINAGSPLPCAPASGLVDCRAELEIDPLSRRTAFVLEMA